MKRLLWMLLLMPWWAAGQDIHHLANHPIPADTANVLSIPLSEDSLSSSFLIVVKKSVRSHKHRRHTENIYVLEGTGVMRLGEKEFDLIPGDFVFIPKDTFHSVRVTSTKPLKVLSLQSPRFNGTDRVWEQP